MKRLLLGLPLLVGTLWAGTTYLSATQTEPVYQQIVQQLNTNPFISAESTNYDSGFINSTAITSINYNDNARVNFSFKLRHIISHSPISIAPGSTRVGEINVITTLFQDESYNDTIKNILSAFNGDEPFIITTKARVDGRTHSNIEIPAIEFNNDGTVLVSSGVSGNLFIQPDGIVSGDIQSNNSQIRIPDQVNANASNIELTFVADSKKQSHASSIYLNDMNVAVTFDSLFGVLPDGQPVEIDGGRFVHDQFLTTDKPIVRTELSTTRLQMANVPINAIDFKSSFSEFSATSLKANAAFLDQLINEQSISDALSNPDFINVLRETITPDASVDIDIKADTKNGQVSSDTTLTFVGKPPVI